MNALGKTQVRLTTRERIYSLLLATQALLPRKMLGVPMKKKISFVQWQRIVHTFDDTLRLPDEHVPFDPLCRDHVS